MISKEPTSCGYGKELRESAKSGRLTLERELELFALDRQEHVKRSIAPALEEGNIVILDRYYLSTAAYQGARGADVDEIIRTNEAFAPKPDLVLLLDVSAEQGLTRIRNRGDKPNLFEKSESLEQARQIFLTTVKSFPHQIIDASQPLTEVFKQALKSMQAAAAQKVSKTDQAPPESVKKILEIFGMAPL